MSDVKSTVFHHRIGDHLITFDSQHLNCIVVGKNNGQASFGTTFLQNYPTKDPGYQETNNVILMVSCAFEPEEILQLYAWIMEKMGVKIPTAQVAPADSVDD